MEEVHMASEVAEHSAAATADVVEGEQVQTSLGQLSVEDDDVLGRGINAFDQGGGADENLNRPLVERPNDPVGQRPWDAAVMESNPLPEGLDEAPFWVIG